MLARPTVAGNWKDQRDIMGIDLLMFGDADCPDKTTSTQALAECSRQAIPGVGKHDTETQTCCHQTINLLQGDLRLGAWLAHLFWHAGFQQPRGIPGPAFGQKQSQGHRHRNLLAGQCQRYQRLTIGSLSKHRRVLRGDADGMLPLLRQSGIVDYKKRIVRADHPVRLAHQLQPKRLIVPDAIGNEMMEAIILSRCQACRHRLDAFAVSRTDQAGDVKRAHRATLPMPKPIDKRL